MGARGKAAKARRAAPVSSGWRAAAPPCCSSSCDLYPSLGRITDALRLSICHGCPTTPEAEGEREPPENHTRGRRHRSAGRDRPCSPSTSLPPLPRTEASRHYGACLGRPRAQDPGPPGLLYTRAHHMFVEMLPCRDS